MTRSNREVRQLSRFFPTPEFQFMTPHFDGRVGYFIDATHIRPPMAVFQTLLSIQPDVLFFLKLFTLLAVGMSIVVRARETAEVPDSSGLLEPMTQPALSHGAPMPAQ